MSELPFAHDIVGATTPWALSPQLASGLYDKAMAVADQYLFSGPATPQALQAFKAAKVRGEGLTRRGSVGIVDVRGALVKRPSFISRLFGMNTYAEVRMDLQAALDDREIKSIILYVDSPGGEVSGADELAAAIYAARGKKPMTTYVSGQACSAAYWLATATSRVVVSDAALIGGIGVVLPVIRHSKDNTEIKQFVSSQSPHKRPDISTDEGKSHIQKMVDDLGSVFVSAIAKHRNVSTATVLEKFGAGGVEIGAKAVKAGMADAVGQFEALLASLDKNAAKNPGDEVSPAAPFAVPVPATKPAKVAETPAARAARERAAKILQSPEGKANPNMAEHLAWQTDMPANEAIAKLQAAKTAEIVGRVIENQNRRTGWVF